MLIEATCHVCSTKASFDGTFVGTKRTCKTCGAGFVLERPRGEAKAPAPKAAKSTSAILFNATCPTCRAQVPADASFAGSKRTCPHCSAFFVLQLPEAVKAQVEAKKIGLRQASEIDRVPFGCARCLRSSPVVAINGASAARCQYCGAASPLEDARAFAALLTHSEGQIISGLLSGYGINELMKGVPAPNQAMVQELIKRVLPEIGRLRRRALDARDRGETVVLKASAHCDTCWRAGGVTPSSVLWERLEEEKTRVSGVSAVTLFAGVLVTEKTGVVRQIAEVVYLCDECEPRPKPPELGFTIAARQRLLPL